MSLRSSLPSCALRGPARRPVALRWGPALNDPTPGDPWGALIDRPDPEWRSSSPTRHEPSQSD